ncbi:MAG: penicillin-binding transpeptidase domain-containing protein [Verrucomicrobiia bacterium]
MLFFDQLKKNDPQLRLLALGIAGSLGILLAGLWWVQIVSAREYESHLETQSYRTVRIPAVRGKILDRHGQVLAENLPRYDLDLYLGDLREQFNAACNRALAQAYANQRKAIAAGEKKLGRSLTKDERRPFELSAGQREQIRDQARFRVANDIVAQVAQKLGQPLAFDAAKFARDYETRLALPVTVLTNLNEAQIARFEEQYAGGLGVDLAVQSDRFYPHGTLAGHVLGYLVRDNRSEQGEDAYFSYRLPDYRGVVGIEGGFDAELRGRAGAEAVLVNNMGYRQSTTILSPPQPGRNVVTTLDLGLEEAATDSIERRLGTNATAAVVVMDVRSGDVLAMVSSPAINPDYSVNDLQHLNDPALRPQINRATQGNYAPGSIFKPIVALAALENGLNPNETYEVEPDPQQPWHGCIYVGRRKIEDTVPPGSYNLKLAIERSSNAYFIYNGLRTGIEKIIRLAEKFHFGERTGLPTGQDTGGDLPSLADVQQPGWHDGDSANICFGQGQITVTPLQMAVAYAAIANGGTVLWPRLVKRLEPQDPDAGGTVVNFPSGVVRDEIGVHPRSLNIVRTAMLGETEDPTGTGRAAVVTGLCICGKTGTAQVQDEQGRITGWNYWFASFAPYADPRYAVVVMVQSENRGSGGSVCAPIAHDIYEEIVKQGNADAPATLARAN